MLENPRNPLLVTAHATKPAPNPLGSLRISLGVASGGFGGSPQMILEHSGTLCPPPCTRQRLTVAGSEQSLSTHQDRVAGLTIPAELIG
jgi:hypothetical protein